MMKNQRLGGNQVLVAAEIRRRIVADVNNDGELNSDDPHTETDGCPSIKS